jgi:hypothetical protein
MEECLGDLNYKICVIYLDDLIIFSKTFDEHLERLDIILAKLKEYNLKLAPTKCYFSIENIKFLGHVANAKGIQTDFDKKDKIQKWPTPKIRDELRSF